MTRRELEPVQMKGGRGVVDEQGVGGIVEDVRPLSGMGIVTTLCRC